MIKRRIDGFAQAKASAFRGFSTRSYFGDIAEAYVYELFY